MSRQVALSLLAALGLAGCDGARWLCRDTVSQALISPDGVHAAETVVRDCGWVGGYSIHVVVRRVKLGRMATVATLGGAWPPRVKWSGPNRLLVAPDARSKVLYQTAQWDGVTLSIGGTPTDLRSEGIP